MVRFGIECDETGELKLYRTVFEGVRISSVGMWWCSKVVIDRPVILFKYPCGRNRRMVGPSGVGDNTKVKRRMNDRGRKKENKKEATA